jgi:hypothetical protein
MPKSRRLEQMIRLLAVTLALLVVPATSWAQQRPAILEQVAKTFGLDGFGQVEGIRYTFNVELPGVNLSRKWEWNPQTDTVSYEGKDKEGKPVNATYERAKLGSQSEAVQTQIDPAFWNDNYWLLLPLRLHWDSNASVTDAGMEKLPSGNGSAQRVIVKYPSDGGYDPGDTWELFVGPDKRVAEMVYRRGGTKKPSLVTASWVGYKKAGPLLFSTDHRGTADEKPLHLSLTDVAVKVKGSATWINAQ